MASLESHHGSELDDQRRQGAMSISSILSSETNAPEDHDGESESHENGYDPARKMSLSTITTRQEPGPTLNSESNLSRVHENSDDDEDDDIDEDLIGEDDEGEEEEDDEYYRRNVNNVENGNTENPENDVFNRDMNFNYFAGLNSNQMKDALSIANEPRYAGEKEEYLKNLTSKIDRIITNESNAHDSHFENQYEHALQKYETRSEMMRKKAHSELQDQAMHRVQKQEEADLKEKRRILKRLERQRKKQDAAAAAVAAGKLNPEQQQDELQGKPSTGRRKRGAGAKGGKQQTSAASKKGGAASSKEDNKKKGGAAGGRKRKHPNDETGSRTRIKLTNGTTPSGGAKSSGSNASSTPSKKGASSATSTPKSKDPKAKPPSQKEIRALARLYNNTYESIWKDISRKDASKVSKLIQSTLNVKQSNLRKTAVLASKEARRWQFRTNKNIKDLQARARRGMREMLAFWRRNEREERDLRKKAEKEALDQAKREEEERESRRQARKLNFLITQTELYSHFIGNKIKTSEVEGSESATPGNHNVDQSSVDVSHASEAKDLDFDNAEDEDLQKAAMANAHNAVLDAQNRAREFDNSSGTGNGDVKNVDIDSDEMNFQNPTSLGALDLPQPKMLTCQLKEYQLKGLNWLANLYEQGINGILADEMGLGKTVQSMSVMAYLAETYNIWGPFLVIAPASTLHNWQQEITRFIPQFKVLPYWGTAKDRKVLRKYWDRKQLTYTKDSQFHVLVTSYQLVVADAQYFHRMKWQYMILDEAQAIKSSGSSRWKNLLSLNCRNRLLLTGTPIQNSMQELWALLHFIMPSIFDSHEEFSDWFSKDIESHAQTNSTLNEEQLKRLHMILKPFMLRRVKKHVQQELGDKIEIDVYCDLTNRQRMLYKMLRSQINVMELIERAASGSDDSNQSLMNLVMQFRKVCNHPDLFEREDVRSAFNFSTFAQTPLLNRDGPVLECSYSARNCIQYTVPTLLYRDGGMLDVPTENSTAGNRIKALENLFNIWKPENVQHSETFNWADFVGLSRGEVSKIGRQGLFERARQRYSITGYQRSSAIFSNYSDGEFNHVESLFLINEKQCAQNIGQQPRDNRQGSVWNDLCSVAERVALNDYYHVSERAYDNRVLCPPINIYCSNRSMENIQEQILFNQEVKSTLATMTLDQEWSLVKSGLQPADFPPSNMYPEVENQKAGFTSIRMPSMAKFVTVSGKLAKLDQLLTELKANDHRVLIYFQMTKMMDLMEEYLTFRQHKYLRLDGSSKLSDRRDLVSDWQTKPELFVFLLSTRAGGLGINLTAADTVIFYDSDWNPTIDSQAMDRAHRLGQTRQVTVYRLLVKGTIEERMRDRAKQKEQVQHVVMEGNNAKQSVDFKEKSGREVVHWLLQPDDADAVDEALRQKEAEAAAANNGSKNKKNGTASPSGSKKSGSKKKGDGASLEDMYHEGEGNFDESNRPSELATPASTSGTSTPVKLTNKKLDAVKALD